MLKADGTTTLKVYFKLYQMDVTVHHYLKGTTVKVMEDVQDKAVFGSAYTPSAYAETYQDKALTRDSHDPQVPVTIRVEGNEITVYYTLPLTITAATAGKVYDGTPLNGSYVITGALEGAGADDSDIPAIQAALGTAPSVTTVEESPEEYLTEAD